MQQLSDLATEITEKNEGMSPSDRNLRDLCVLCGYFQIYCICLKCYQF